MEKTVLISLCSLFFFGFTLNSHTVPDQKKENITEAIERVNVIATIPDSIPSKGTYTIHKKTDDQEISIQVTDGDIKELKIDGKEIAPAQFDHYDEVIDELFGSMEAAPSAEGFNFTMPAIPEMPGMPDMPAMMYSYSMSPMSPMSPMPNMPAMPCMPPMPAMGMNEMELEHLLGNGTNLEILKAENLDHLIRGQMGNLMFLSDTNGPGAAKIIIIRDGDSTVIVSPDINWAANSPGLHLDYFMQDKDEWKQQQEEWKEHQKEWKDHAKEWKQNWEENAQQWQEGWRAQQEAMQAEQERMRSQGDWASDEMREKLNSEDYARALQDELRAQGLGNARIYGHMAPRMNMTQEMIEEGLVEPGEEADILLTPDKLKINGKKMPDDVHERYLRMYEQQQGVELSGKSRVEFKTKSRRSM